MPKHGGHCWTNASIRTGLVLKSEWTSQQPNSVSVTVLMAFNRFMPTFCLEGKTQLQGKSPDTFGQAFRSWNAQSGAAPREPNYFTGCTRHPILHGWDDKDGKRNRCSDPSLTMMRLKGGVQGSYMDKMDKAQKRGRLALRNEPEKQVLERMMNIKEFPTELEPKPIVWERPIDDVMDYDNLNYITQPQPNPHRIVYNTVGGDEAAYRGFGLAGMAVEAPRKWPYAIPETVGHRSWKSVNVEVNGTFIRRRGSQGAMKTSFKTSWRHKMELKERKAALRGVVKKLQAKAVAAKEAERKRLQARRLIKLQNRRNAEQYHIITNPKKLALKSKKQLRQLRRVEGPSGYTPAPRLKQS